MKTNYQRVLHSLSLLQKASKKVDPEEMIQIFFAFIDEVKKDVESGIELKQIAALQKLKNIKEIIDQMKEEDFSQIRPENFPDELKQIHENIKSQLKVKLDAVIHAIDEKMR